MVSFRELDFQSIIGDSDIGRQRFLGALGQLMADVSEKRARRLDPLCNVEGLGNAQVSWVRFFSQGIDDKQFDILDFARDVIGHNAAITQIREESPATPGEEVAIRLRFPVGHGQWSDKSFAKRKWTADNMRLRF